MGFPLLSIESSSSAFSKILLNLLCLYECRVNSTFCALGEGVLMWACPYADCLCPFSFTEWLVWRGCQSHFSPWYAVSSHLGRGEGRAGEGEAGVGSGGEAGCPLCLVAVPTLPEQGLIPSCWRGKNWAPPSSIVFKCLFLPLPALGPLPQRKGVLKQAGPCADRGPVHSLGRLLHLSSDAALVVSPLCLSGLITAATATSRTLSWNH